MKKNACYLLITLLVISCSKNEEDLYNAIDYNAPSEVLNMLENNKLNINHSFNQDSTKTALIRAIEIGNIKVIQTLLAHGADPNLKPKTNGNWQIDLFGIEGPIHVAARMNVSPEILKLLIEHGANVNSMGRIGTAICQCNNLKKVEILVNNGAYYKHICEDGKTPFHLLTELEELNESQVYGDIDYLAIARFLETLDFDFLTAEDKHNLTPIEYFAKNDSESLFTAYYLASKKRLSTEKKADLKELIENLLETKTATRISKNYHLLELSSHFPATFESETSN